VAAAAARRGLRLERATRGPFYRIDLYEGDAAARRRGERQAEQIQARRRAAAGLGAAAGQAAAAGQPAATKKPPAPLPLPRPELLATTDGFCVPFWPRLPSLLGPSSGPFVHCDTLRIPQRLSLGEEKESAADGPGGGGREESALGLMPLIGCAVLAHAREWGCGRIEILAIDDDDGSTGTNGGGMSEGAARYARLQRYYRFFGFRPRHRVGGRGFFTDLPHLLVWGGEGMRMDIEVEPTLRKWARVVDKGNDDEKEKDDGDGRAREGSAT
jgi:hypothetical protein